MMYIKMARLLNSFNSLAIYEIFLKLLVILLRNYLFGQSIEYEYLHAHSYQIDK